MNSEMRNLEEVQTSSNAHSFQRQYSYGPEVDVNAFLPRECIGKPWAREQIASVCVGTVRKHRVWVRPKQPGTRSVIIIHEAFGPAIVVYRNGDIIDVQVLEAIATGQPVTVDVTARVKNQAANELKVRANLNALEERALEVFYARLQAQDAERARQERITAEVELAAREQAHRNKVQGILNRGKTRVTTKNGALLKGYRVHGDEWQVLDDGTCCITGPDETLKLFFVKKSKGGRVSKQDEQRVLVYAHTASVQEEVRPTEVVSLVKLVGRDAPAAVFPNKRELLSYLQTNRDNEGGLMDQSGKVQMFRSNKGVLVSLGHFEIDGAAAKVAA